MKKTAIILFVFMLIPVSGLFSQNSGELDHVVELCRAEQYDKAKDILEKYIKANPKDAQAFYYLGRVYYIKQDYDEAVKQLEKSVKLDEKNSEYYRWLGQAYGQKAQRASIFSKLSLAKKCKEAQEKAYELDPNNINALLDLIGFYREAPGIVGGDTKKALQLANEAKKLDTRRGYIAVIGVYVKEGKIESALNEYKEMLKNSEPHFNSAFQIARSLSREERESEALDIFGDKLIKRYWNNHGALNTYAWFWAPLGKNLESAFNASKKSLELAPENHYYWDTLSMIYWKQKQYDKAIEAEEKALEYSPGNKDYKKRIKDIKKDMNKK